MGLNILAGIRSSSRARLRAWIRRRQGADALPLTLERRRLYILPTRAGLGFGVLLLFMLLAGLNYGSSLALFLTFLLCGFVLVTMHLCHRNLLGTSLRTAAAAPTFAHRTGVLHLILGNAAPLWRYRIESGVSDQPTLAADIPARGRQGVDLPVPAPARGLVRVDRLRLTTTHPFGLFRAWTWVHAPIDMIVYPRPYGALPMPTERGRQSGTRSRGNSGADEWRGLRPFRDGDSPRQVDWKAYAREAPLLVKEYSAAGSELRIFDFGQLANLNTEARLEQLARWVLDAEARGERYGLELPGAQIPPDRGTDHRHRCLAALALYNDGAAVIGSNVAHGDNIGERRVN
ncbi:MAG: hypothetical protein JWN85_2491 [Gammaproteobacteria bacterium]|nr:hypothetical protein [Gammaproteobacteria bacterium]